MRDRYKNTLMWALYALLFLLVMVLQTVVFGRARFFGAKLSLVPVAVACIAMQCGAERGGAFGLAAGTVWCLSGGDGGGVTLVLLTVCALLSGWFCDCYLNRRLLSAALMSLLSLLVVQGALFAFKFYLGTAGSSFWRLLPVQLALSMLACPPIYWAAWGIRKAGA